MDMSSFLRPILEEYLASKQLKPKDPTYASKPHLAFYNNFFVAQVDFFLTKDVANLLLTIDHSQIMYIYRVNDLIIQSMLVRSFLCLHETYRFKEFTYEHVSEDQKTGCPTNGGVFKGTGHATSSFIKYCQLLEGKYSGWPSLYKRTTNDSWCGGQNR